MHDYANPGGMENVNCVSISSEEGSCQDESLELRKQEEWTSQKGRELWELHMVPDG